MQQQLQKFRVSATVLMTQTMQKSPTKNKITYRKVASSRLSRLVLVAHSKIFRLFMKGNFDAYVL